MKKIQLVDIAALWSGDVAAIAQADKAIWAALQSTGGLVITGFPGVRQVDHWGRVGTSIHDAPAPLKRSLSIAVYQPGNPNYYRGYHPMQPGTFRVNIHDIGPEQPAAGPDLPGIQYMTEPTPWPLESAMPGWRKAVTDCYHHMNRISLKLILAIGRSAGFSEKTILERFAGEHSTLRFLDYPAGDHADTGGVAAHRHVDASGLSLLWQREPGLQAEGPDGDFYDVPMIDNCISVHVGTVIESLTNGAVRATPHRVLGSGGARRSMGFFLEPALSASLLPVGADSAEYSVRDTYAWLLLKTHHSREKYADLIPDPDTAAMGQQ